MTSPQTAALARVVEAWEALPGNQHYRVGEVQAWLSHTMKPAIDNARAVLAAKSA